MKCELESLDRKFRQGFGVGGEMASPAMKSAIEDWFCLYFGEEAPEEDASQRLACLIVQKLCRACFAEYEAQAAGFYESCLPALDRVKKQAMQLALIGGEAWIKPVPAEGGIYFTVVRRDQAVVLGRDGLGRVTDLGSGMRLVKNGRTFTLLERRSLDGGGRLVIESRLFEGRGDTLGVQVPLSVLAETAHLVPKLVLPPLGGLGLAPLRLSLENCVDGGPEGVSVYAPAAKLIHRLQKGQRQLEREFENGASRVFASADLLRRRGRERVLPEGLFVGLDDDPDSTGITIFSPKLREESFLARKADGLRDLESLVGLKRGLLGPVEAAQRTATEVTSSEGDYALTLRDLRESWETAAAAALELSEKIARVYGIKGPEGESRLAIHWGDDILKGEKG